MALNTNHSYDAVIGSCRSLFVSKMEDYGPSWLVFRIGSLIDQVLIKAKRIRSLEEKEDKSMIGDGRGVEYIAIVNYCTMALMRLRHQKTLPSWESIFSVEKVGFNEQQLLQLYDQTIADTKALMLAKNHDYDEAWRQMRISSITDQILVKLNRLQQIDRNEGITKASEGMDGQFEDILNYAVFALIKLYEQK